MKSTTAAVVVTYNRKALLIECIESLLKQTKPLDQIFIIDNASTDGTYECVGDKNYSDREDVTYIRLAVNSGGSGGFYEGMRAAFEAGYDWIWIMDDDAEPEPDAYDHLQQGFVGQNVVASLVCDRDGRAITSHHRANFASIYDQIVTPILADKIESNYVEIDHASFVGVAYSRRIIAEFGLPKKEFFIHFDDYEYSVRIAGKQKIRLALNSRIRHKEQAKSSVKFDGFLFGKKLARVKYESLWLQYYGFRNLLWIQLQRSRVKSYFYALPFLFKKVIRALLHDDHKIKRIRFWFSAFSDARKGVFDNAKPRRILYN